MVDLDFLVSLGSVVQELQIQNHTRSWHLPRPFEVRSSCQKLDAPVTFKAGTLS